jgi:photosystem II stability/assembly factor-like uncharacterized protein
MAADAALMADAELQWSPTSARLVRSRYDDVWFRDLNTGWAVNSDGQILKTTNGGDRWDIKFQTPLTPTGRPIYLRCLAFASELVGWAGTLTQEQRLFGTRDGGESWKAVENLPAGAPEKVCGLWAVNQSVVYGSGTNDPRDGAGIIKTVDGGQTWTSVDMSAHAHSLIDIYFPTPDQGWVVGGFSNQPNPSYDNVKPVILRTEDGGKTWDDRLKSMRSEFPEGTWGWKIQFLDNQLGFVSLENFTQAFILKTTDGGKSWTKLPVTDNANLEGVGFLNATEGWVGGWGDEGFVSGKSSVTSDGGQTWRNADAIGKFINRFRFFGNPVTAGYAAGRTIYKYGRKAESAPQALDAAAPRMKFFASDATETFSAAEVPITFNLPAGSRRATIHIWNRFGKNVRTLLDEKNPAAGQRTVRWDRRDDNGEPVRPGAYIYRLTSDGEAESRVIALR